MHFDMPHLLLAFLFSGIGYVYFSYGRKQTEPRFIVAGVVLMAYGYFVDSLLWTTGIGMVLSALPFFI